MLAWEEGCKGITVYRAGSREKEVLVKGNKETAEQPALDGFELENNMISQNITLPDHNCCDDPNIIFESGCHTCKVCGWSACVVS